MKISNSIIILGIILSNIGCSNMPKYSDGNDELPVEEIFKIEFKKPGNETCQTAFEEFEIIKRESIHEFVTILNNSKLDGPRKGACFRRINLILKDSVITISTTGKVFGHGSSGIFYAFPEPDIIEKFRVD